MKALLALFAAAMLMGYEPAVSPPVQQSQSSYLLSSEERFLNSVMVRAYNSGDKDSLKELLQYWRDAHGTTAL